MITPADYTNWGKKLTVNTVVYPPRKLKAMWTIDIKEDLYAYHGIQDIEKFEKINKILYDIFKSKYI
jgi:hypothetical protein